MSEREYHTTLTESIKKGKEIFLRRFPDFEWQIEDYAFEVAIAANDTFVPLPCFKKNPDKSIESKLDDLCRLLDSIDKSNLCGLSPEALRYVAAIRKFVRNQILNNEIVLCFVPLAKREKPING